MSDSTSAHPDSPAGGGGPGFFKNPKPLGTNAEFNAWESIRWPLGRDPLGLIAAMCNQAAPQATTLAAAPVKGQAPAETDPEIEALDLSPVANEAAYQLKREYPSVIFTSGRRDKDKQARAMAENVVLNRRWIEETYAPSAARDACQKWVDANKNKKTKAEIAAGLTGVLDYLTDAQLAKLSKHLSGDAFDVQPVEKNANEIKKAIRDLPGLSKFLEKEGGLVRWHAQF